MIRLSLDALEVDSFTTQDPALASSDPAPAVAFQLAAGTDTAFCDTDALQVCTKFCQAA